MIRKINEHGLKGLNGFSLSRMGYEHELSLITHELIHEFEFDMKTRGLASLRPKPYIVDSAF